MRFMINREILLTKLYKPYKTQFGEAGCRSCRSGAFALFLTIIVSVPQFYVVHVLLQYCATLLSNRQHYLLFLLFEAWTDLRNHTN